MTAWRVLFTIAALTNIAVGLAFLTSAATLLPTLRMEMPANPVFLQLTGAFILLFGVAYGIVARDPARQRVIVLLGAVGKVIAVLIVGVATMSGQASPAFLARLSGDLVFAALFTAFLLRTRPA